MEITHYMDPKLVAIIQVDTRDEVLELLVNKVYETGRLEDKERFLRALLEREKIVSTGIGMGVALPHAKLHGYDKFFIAIAVLQKPVDWKALDGAPVRLVFMIGGPDDKQTEYLQILSTLTQVIKDEERRKKLLSVNDPNTIIELFRTI